MPSLIVAVHRDPSQSTALRSALNELIDADIVVADSISDALDVIDAGTPDLILVDPLIPPREADGLSGYLALLPDAAHVQTISAPMISVSSERDSSLDVGTWRARLRRRLWPRRRSRGVSTNPSWNPEAFAGEVAAYLSVSLAIRTENDQRNDDREYYRPAERRRASRWSARQASIAEPVYVMANRADVVNISSTGLLVRTGLRPYPRPPELDEAVEGNRSPVTLLSASGDVIQRTATPIRCRAKALGDQGFLYEVAFLFDEPLDLESADAVTVRKAYAQAETAMALAVKSNRGTLRRWDSGSSAPTTALVKLVGAG